MNREEQQQEFRWMAELITDLGAYGIRLFRVWLILQGVAVIILLLVVGFSFTSGGWLGWLLLVLIGLCIAGHLTERPSPPKDS